jgi:hypothetical protein
MKRGLKISIVLLVIGLILEGLHFTTSIRFFEIKLWLIGGISLLLGIAGVSWYGIIPLLEKRARTLGKFKKENLRKNAKKS